jgi:hypothetical protein
VKLLRTLSLGKRATSRRQLLKALGVSAAAAPFVPALDGWAAGTGPKRLLLVFSPHGVIPETYWPSGGETDFTFPPGGILEPLAPHKADMIHFKGLKRPTSGRGAHEIVMVNLWTGTSMHGSTQDATGPSIDQIIAKAQPRMTSFESLQFGAQTTFWGEGDIASHYASPNSTMIYAGTQQRMYPENDPYKMFDRLFSGPVMAAAGNAADAERLRAEKQSILDFVKDELADVDQKVGREDRLKIASHLAATREIERHLQEPAKACGGVTRPDGTLDLGANDNHPKIIPIVNKLVVAALTCDRTRIASLQYSRSFSNQKHTWAGAKDGHHSISHMTSAAAKSTLTAIQRFYMTHLASLVTDLKAVQEGGRPLLDNMLLAYCHELYTPWNHVAEPSACFLMGKLGGTIPRTGRLIDYGNNQDHNQFLVTICQAMGLQINKVGNLGKEGVLPGVLA